MGWNPHCLVVNFVLRTRDRAPGTTAGFLFPGSCVFVCVEVCRGFMLTQWGRWYAWEVNGTAHASTHFTGVQGDTGVTSCTGGVMVLVGIDACPYKLMESGYGPRYRDLCDTGLCPVTNLLTIGLMVSVGYFYERASETGGLL
jgi:hypothetical protein